MTTNVPLPNELVRELEAQAKRHGLTLTSYLSLLSRAAARNHDNDFMSAARYLFSKYPDAMRKLAK